MKTVLSLGAGVQSSTLALMCELGEITPKPDLAVFADTQAEPEEVYKWLDWLEQQVSFPIVRVSHGNLFNDVNEVRTSKKSGRKYLKTSIPAFTQGKTKGKLMRQCTVDYKVRIIQRAIKSNLGVKYIHKIKGWNDSVNLYMGISTDEAHRMKDSRVPFITNIYPLIDSGMSRQDCLDWMSVHNYPKPPRSACVFCPYHSDAEWLRLKENPIEWSKILEFEQNFFDAQKEQEVLTDTAYLHDSRRPLSEVILDIKHNPNLMGEECEGLCGI